MSRRYKLEELLNLQASPLVHKPENLPPAEEWMGTLESHVKKILPVRGHAEEQNQHGKRPGLADFHHVSRRSSTAPEDIVLGPPKTAFSSSNARNPAKQIGSEVLEELPANKDRSSLHERHNNDKENGDKDLERKEGRQNGLIARRAGRDDRDDWQSGRQRRNFDQEDGDTKVRRFGDRERDRTRWDTRPGKDTLDGEGDGERPPADGRLGSRRDVQGRAKFEQPWVRGGKLPESEQQGNRNEWRRERGADRGDEWERGRYAKTEQDPEWMDSAEPEEPNQKHTQEDFQKWKERMKAGGTPSEEKANPINEGQLTAIPKPEAPKLEALSKPAIITTPEIDAAMDKFFANFNEKAGDTKIAEAKAPRKGRFAAFFSPPPEEPVKEVPAASKPADIEENRTSLPQPVGMSAADQAGFQRILQMLGQRGSNTTPQEPIGTNSKASSVAKEQQLGPSTQPRSPVADLPRRQNGPVQRDTSSQNIMSTGLENLLGSPSPGRENVSRPQSASNKDTELLLRLMQQPSQPTPLSKTNGTMPQGSRQTPGILQMRDAQHRSSRQQGETNTQPLYMERPPGLDPGRHEQQTPREVLQRRPTNGHASLPFDEPFFNELRQTNQQQQQPVSIPTHQYRNQAMPLGMQRPPGFEQAQALPPLGWSGHQSMPTQHQHQLQHQQGLMNAPPGIPNPAHRGGMNQVYPPLSATQAPRQMAMGMGMPTAQQAQSAQRQRKYTGEGISSFPPGMGPPPGFMTNGPPPGFPAMPHGVGTGGSQFDGTGNMNSRHLMDMYAGGQRSGGRGGPAGGGGGGGGGMLGGYQ